MLSILRKGLVYKNISSDIVEHDADVDADQWNYNDKDVYRGSIDLQYLPYKLNVYWLYDDSLQRIGLAEHETDSPEIFQALWFYDNPYATLYQDPRWKSTDTTIWSKVTNEVYLDFLEGMNIDDLALASNVLLVTPDMLIHPPKLYSCPKCNKKSRMRENVCSPALETELNFSDFSVLFLDDDRIVYEHSTAPPEPAGDGTQEPVQEADPLQEMALPELPQTPKEGEHPAPPSPPPHPLPLHQTHPQQ